MNPLFYSRLRHELPLAHKGLLTVLTLVAFGIGLLLDYQLGTRLDTAIHDSAIISQPRNQWQHTAIIALDRGVPLEVSRKQMLPLYALATERAVKAGAAVVFLDARLSLDIERRMPYATCIDKEGAIKWSLPRCALNNPKNTIDNPNNTINSANNPQCRLASNPTAQRGPFSLSSQSLERFMMAPPLTEKTPPPLWMMYGPLAMQTLGPDAIANVEINTLDNKLQDGVSRRFVLNPDFSAAAIASRLEPDLIQTRLIPSVDDASCLGSFCRRLRFSSPNYTLDNQNLPMLAVSRLASCEENTALTYASQLKNKAVVLQLSGLDESTDLHVTPMTVAWGSPHKLTAGPQLIADSIETLMMDDAPRRPALVWRILIMGLGALTGVMAGALLRNSIAITVPFLWTLLLTLLSFLSPLIQLWPIAVCTLTCLIGVVGAMGWHLAMGAKRGALVARYLPPPIRQMLLSLKGDQAFINQRRHAVILISDLAGYTTITNLLNDPAAVINLLNDYLDETTITLQGRYDGWLEGYVGDEVCFYWPSADNEFDAIQTTKALEGALKLSRLQQSYFQSLATRKITNIDKTLNRVSQNINAGIGLAAGEVVMGNMGPENGVQKFGILGDAINLTSRVEALTRHFNTEILVTDRLGEEARKLGMGVRRVTQVKVKGRTKVTVLYAVGRSDDARFEPTRVAAWEVWAQSCEQGKIPPIDPDPLYRQDTTTLKKWLASDLLNTEEQTWVLTEK